MELHLILSFLGASILLTLMPGPDILLVLTESISKGKRNGIALSIGLCSGVLVHTILAATGLSIIILNSDLAFQFIKYLGGIYLIYLAILAFKEQRAVINDSKGVNEDDVAKLVKRGFLMNVLNPKVSLFFIAFLPQFISEDGFNITVQMIVLGVIFMIQALLVFSIVAQFAGGLSGYLNSDRFWEITKYIKVLVLVGLGVYLIVH